MMNQPTNTNQQSAYNTMPGTGYNPPPPGYYPPPAPPPPYIPTTAERKPSFVLTFVSLILAVIVGVGTLIVATQMASRLAAL